MKTYSILYRHNGENSNTAKDPDRVYVPGTVDLDAKKLCCLNWDDNRLVETDLYAIHEVALPDWLDPVEWIRDSISWAWLWGMGADKGWAEGWQRGLVGLGESKKYAAIKLLKTATRSPFRKSLKAQLIAWLETDADKRVYHDPFSPRQWNALLDVFTVRAARNTASNLYYGHRYNEIG